MKQNLYDTARETFTNRAVHSKERREKKLINGSATTCDPERFYSKSGENPEAKKCKIQRKSGVENVKSGHK